MHSMSQLSPDGKWMWDGTEWIPAPPSSSTESPQSTDLMVQDSAVAGDINVTQQTNIHQSADAEVIKVALEGVSSLVEKQKEGKNDMILGGWELMIDGDIAGAIKDPTITEARLLFNQMLAGSGQSLNFTIPSWPFPPPEGCSCNWISFEDNSYRHNESAAKFYIMSSLGGITDKRQIGEYDYWTNGEWELTEIFEAVLAINYTKLSHFEWLGGNDKPIRETMAEIDSQSVEESLASKLAGLLFLGGCLIFLFMVVSQTPIF